MIEIKLIIDNKIAYPDSPKNFVLEQVLKNNHVLYEIKKLEVKQK